MVSHRNHIGILSAMALSLSCDMTINLSLDDADILGGSNGIGFVGNGRYALFSGDYNGNAQVQNSDVTGIQPFIGLPGYENADIDMNGQVQNSDILNLVYPNIGKGQQLSRKGMFAKRRNK